MNNDGNGYLPWYSGSAFCTGSETCAFAVYWHIAAAPKFWRSDEPVLLEFYTHFSANISVHLLAEAFIVSTVFFTF